MQSLLDTLLLLAVTVCTLAVSMIVGCGSKKPKVMTDMPNTGGADSKMGGNTGSTNSGAPPPAPPPTAVSQDSKDKKDAGPKSLKPASPATNPADQSDKKVSEVKKVPAGAVEDDGGYENCKDMSPEELKKAL